MNLQDRQCTEIWLVFHVLHGEFFQPDWLKCHSLPHDQYLFLLAFTDARWSHADSHWFLYICCYCSSNCVPREVIYVSILIYLFFFGFKEHKVAKQKKLLEGIFFLGEERSFKSSFHKIENVEKSVNFVYFTGLGLIVSQSQYCCFHLMLLILLREIFVSWRIYGLLKLLKKIKNLYQSVLSSLIYMAIRWVNVNKKAESLQLPNIKYLLLLFVLFLV